MQGAHTGQPQRPPPAEQDMELTTEAIRAIANWQSAYPGFDRDDDVACEAHIRAICESITSSGELDCHVLATGGLSNYAVVFVFDKKDVEASFAYPMVNGLLVYLSLCAPVAVAGHARKCADPDMTCRQPLAINGLMGPGSFRTPMETRTLAALGLAGYQVLSAEEVSRPLPPGVERYGYCSADVPSDCLFTALFSDTD
jgi:hypothetical protein